LDKSIAHVGGDQAIVTNVGLSELEATAVDGFRLIDGSTGDSEGGGLEILESSG
jgi:hypothetical protein